MKQCYARGKVKQQKPAWLYKKFAEQDSAEGYIDRIARVCEDAPRYKRARMFGIDSYSET
jgi:hypothetical protein